ncbi:hypothetical protein DSO57_1021827 [Entomophthora muscae]|uniref:Uncharacterized protein n=1 Tax=Entomophthora muscae TaxID=34485 RepID=A0ACC2UN51_9FUNG|nr:hypothetical protein DSO57_1021827 [Entomophthora muscae]
MVSGQSMITNNDSNCSGLTPGDVGSNVEAGNILCLVLASLVASPSVVQSIPPPDPPVFCGVDLLTAKALPKSQMSS